MCRTTEKVEGGASAGTEKKTAGTCQRVEESERVESEGTEKKMA